MHYFLFIVSFLIKIVVETPSEHKQVYPTNFQNKFLAKIKGTVHLKNQKHLCLILPVVLLII